MQKACADNGQKLQLRIQEGYDHVNRSEVEPLRYLIVKARGGRARRARCGGAFDI